MKSYGKGYRTCGTAFGGGRKERLLILPPQDQEQASRSAPRALPERSQSSPRALLLLRCRLLGELLLLLLQERLPRPLVLGGEDQGRLPALLLLQELLLLPQQAAAKEQEQELPQQAKALSQGQ